MIRTCGPCDPLVGAAIVRRVAATIDARLEGSLRFLTGGAQDQEP